MICGEYLLIFCLVVLLCVTLPVNAGELVDQNDSCEFWASTGECENNPDYMLNYCAFSCSKSLKPAYHFEYFYGRLDSLCYAVPLLINTSL
jgi:hypothetical protein